MSNTSMMLCLLEACRKKTVCVHQAKPPPSPLFHEKQEVEATFKNYLHPPLSPHLHVTIKRRSPICTNFAPLLIPVTSYKWGRWEEQWEKKPKKEMENHSFLLRNRNQKWCKSGTDWASSQKKFLCKGWCTFFYLPLTKKA